MLSAGAGSARTGHPVHLLRSTAVLMGETRRLVGCCPTAAQTLLDLGAPAHKGALLFMPASKGPKRSARATLGQPVFRCMPWGSWSWGRRRSCLRSASTQRSTWAGACVCVCVEGGISCVLYGLKRAGACEAGCVRSGELHTAPRAQHGAAQAEHAECAGARHASPEVACHSSCPRARTA